MSRMNNSISSLNTSSSKQRYTFSKSPRFQSNQRPVNDSFYNLPGTRVNRSTSFGFGQKDIGMRFQKISPSPQAYNLNSDFNNTKKKGFSFGEGRQDMEITGPLNQSLTKRYIPSPNLYFPKRQIQAYNITLKSRFQDKSSQHLKKIPGPGTYNLEQIGSSNYYISSRHLNQINYKISQSPRPDTTGNIKKDNPKLGPGTYNLKSTQMNRLGEYFNSKIKNSQARKFPKQQRPSPVIKHLLTTPGPTKYERMSEFGK